MAHKSVRLERAAPLGQHRARSDEAEGAALGRRDIGDTQRLTTAQILHLQRTAGNQAVNATLRPKTSTSHASTVQRLLPSYDSFISGARSKNLDAELFTQNAGEAALTELRHANLGKTVDKYPTTAIGFFSFKANILKKYELYEENPSIETITELFDTITYWEALNNANSGQKWYPKAIQYLKELKGRIGKEVQAETEKQFGTKADIKNLEQTAKLRTAKDQESSAIMPGFMKEIGVAPRYFAQHLKDFPDRINGLKAFYDALKGGDLKAAESAYTNIGSIPGMYLIKPLVVHRFASEAGLGGTVGTKSKKGEELSKAEKQAIVTYSGQAYLPINAQLRASLQRPDSAFELEAFEKFWQERSAKKVHSETMATAVSGMNKLPPYKGIAYRGLVTQPKGYFDVIQPGAMIVDLAFQSASPSLRGVEDFLYNQYGSKHVYFMIHAKSAVNIMQFSKTATEGEVLFKPGTKFQVKAVWHHVQGKVPTNAPPEAQMILHSRTEHKTLGVPERLIGNMTGMTSKDVDGGKGTLLTHEEREGLEWHQVKVIEMVEVPA
jgi:hypothetical protein